MTTGWASKRTSFFFFPSQPSFLVRREFLGFSIPHFWVRAQGLRERMAFCILPALV